MANIDEVAAKKRSKGKHILVIDDVVEVTPKETINIQGKGNSARDELWLACAGRIQIPSPGESVFYFPQGHIEQIEACVNDEGDSEIPKYDLPYKILCKVVQCDLLVEQNTDEVFAKIDLLPEPFALQNKGESYGKEASSSASAKPLATARVLSKKLTPSDTSIQGALFIPKSIADGCLPPLDMSKKIPTQDIVAKDLHGLEWTFRYAYYGQPRRHMFTNGWATFLHAKKLVVGDVCFFLRGENDEVYIGFRRQRKTVQRKMNAQVLSCNAMKHGILANAHLALSTKTILTVFHHPLSLPERFVIPYDEYMKAQSFNYEVGTRIKMQYQISEAYLGLGSSIIAGSIIGTEDVDGFRWPGSEWRCLKVNWDGICEGKGLPVTVSPWSVEISSSKKKMAIPSGHQALNDSELNGGDEGRELAHPRSDEQHIEWGRGLHLHPPKQQ